VDESDIVVFGNLVDSRTVPEKLQERAPKTIILFNSFPQMTDFLDVFWHFVSKYYT